MKSAKPDTKLRIFVGYDSREREAYEVAIGSICRRASVPVWISRLELKNLPMLTRPIEQRDGKMWDPISQAPMATEFAVSRFCVPFLSSHQWALFCDCDIVCLEDIAQLFRDYTADPKYAVMVAKHGTEGTAGTKMDGQVQTVYPRKNWSSVVLWNVDHPANRRLTLEHLNTWPGRDLHAFKWLEESEIGELPVSWNYLVGVYRQEMKIDLAHFTLGGPWLPGWKGGPMDELWLKERAELKCVRL